MSCSSKKYREKRNGEKFHLLFPITLQGQRPTHKNSERSHRQQLADKYSTPAPEMRSHSGPDATGRSAHNAARTPAETSDSAAGGHDDQGSYRRSRPGRAVRLVRRSDNEADSASATTGHAARPPPLPLPPLAAGR